MAEHLPRLLSDFLSLTNTIQNSLKERDAFWLTASVVLADSWAVSMLKQARASSWDGIEKQSCSDHGNPEMRSKQEPGTRDNYEFHSTAQCPASSN